MVHAGVNHLAVLIAALAIWLVGTIRYGLFRPAWSTALERTQGQRIVHSGKPSLILYVTAFVADLIIAYVLAGAIGHLGIGQVTLKNGVISAAILWLGLVATTFTVTNAFAGRRPMLTAIDAGHWFVALLFAGAVIGLMGTA